jgi:ferredoxin
MIVAERKPFDKIYEIAKQYKRILLLGCGSCVTVCMAGGQKEVGILASQLKLKAREDGIELAVDEHTITRQCDREFFDEETARKIKGADAVISMACGVGPQFLSEAYPDQTFFPAVNTTFFGGATAHGVWEERCAGCGTCIIHNFDGLCPIARCAKSLLHGPCGGSSQGVCEISKDTVCIWDLIVKKKIAQGRLEDLVCVREPKDWRTSRDGGPRRSIREELAE